MKRILIVGFTCVLFSVVRVHARQQFFATDHDITSSLINIIFQDKNGMVWVGTEDGLNRYDGSKFTQYRNVPGDSTSLAHNYVNTVFEDSRGHLFVGTHRGLQMYNPAIDKFTPLARTEDGEVYNASIACLFEPEPDSVFTLRNVRTKIIKADFDGIVVRRLQDELSLLYDMDGGLCDAAGFRWFYNKDGLYRVNKMNEIVSRHDEINDPVSLRAIVSRDGTLFVAAFTKGLYRYDILADRFLKVPDDGYKSLSIKSLYASESEPDIYLATDGGGLKRFNPDSGTFTNVSFGNGVINDINPKVHSVLKDKGGNIWVAIFQKGLIMIPDHQDTFKYIGHKSFASNLIGNNCVVALVRDNREGHLWVGVDNGGLYEINLVTNDVRHYGNGVPSIISGLYVDSHDNLWIGSYAGGCGIFDTVSKQFRRVSLKSDNGQEAMNVYGFSEDDEGKVWIATLGGGLFSYDLVTGRVESGESHTQDKWFTSSHYSKINKALYLGTYDGLIKIDSINNGGQPEKLFGSNIIHSVRESKDGNIWLASSAGLVSYSPVDGAMSVYTTEDGLPVNTVYSVEEGDDGRLWISTGHGLSQFDRKKGQFTNFFVDDGLQGNEFYKNASYRDASGILYFGGTDGITYFDPQDVIKPGRKWTVRISDVYLHGKPVRGDMLSGGRPILDGPVYDASEIHLGYDDNSFSVEFATEQFGNPESMAYQYSIDGDKWVTLSHGQNMVNFSELNPGRHSLRVKAVDNGVESEERTVYFVIGNPWYASWWAWTIYALAAGALLCFIYLELKRRQRMRRIELQRKQAEQINEAKFQYFINISHEIRTPMSLVVSPLQKLIDSDGDASRQKNYRLIQRNANRVLRLINELMDVRKIDKKRLKLTFAETPMVPFLDDLYDTFHPAALAKEIDFRFEHQGCDELSLWVDRANFDKIVMNLLSNAVKYTPKGGNIVMRLSTGTDGSVTGPLRNYAEISVTDTGIGIADVEKSHIFERFYQVQGNTSGGTGVGLHLTHSLVKLHYGLIRVEDNPDGNGTRFVVRLPIGCAHLSNEKIESADAEAHSETHMKRLASTRLAPSIVTDEIADDKPDTPRQGASKGTIFVVEDDEDIRNYLSNELSRDYRVEVFADGKSAYDSIVRKAPDLVISDVMMPQMDGYELTSKIKKNINLNHIPVVLLTAKTRDEDNIKGLEAGADAYITKPFALEMLLSTVAAQLRKHRQLKNAFSGQQTQDDKIAGIQVESYDDKLMTKIMKVINDNISNSDITVEMLASEVGLSRVHLHRKLKELTNQAPREFIRNTRLRVAAKMLVESRLSVSDVAMAVGFKNANNFATAFKALYGVSPTEYVDLNQA